VYWYKLDDDKQNLRRYEDAAALHPVKINSQTGKDYFSFVQNMHFIETYNRLQQKINIPIVHELHRGRFNYAPFIAQQYFVTTQFNITADFSHWCCVTESLLQAPQWQPVMQEAINRSTHIHARVGFAEGSQVNDPRAMENATALAMHLQWWDAIVATQRQQGLSMLTITPEFGPTPYMHTQPHTQTPLANQWEINEWLLQLLKKRYAV
jgi:hypothetical protein